MKQGELSPYTTWCWDCSMRDGRHRVTCRRTDNSPGQWRSNEMRKHLGMS